MKELFNFDPSQVTIDFTSAFSYTPKILKNYIVNRHRTGLLYIRKGIYEYSWQSGAFRAEAESLIYLPPDCQPYSYAITFPSDSQGAETMQIEFNLRDINTNLPYAYSEHPIVLFENAQFLKERFEMVISAFTINSKLNLYASLFSLLSACAKENRTAPESAEKIAPALIYLNEHYAEHIDVKALADLCYISTSQLTRLFKKHLGISPIAYRNKLRLDCARRLLENPELSIGEIADMLGFYDVYAFSHFFTSATGLPPSKTKGKIFGL